MSMKKNSIIFNLLVYIFIMFVCLDIFRYYFIKYLKGISFYGLLFTLTIIVFFRFKKTTTDNLHKKQLLFFIWWFVVFVFINQFCLEYKYYQTILGINLNIFIIRSIQVFCGLIIFNYLDSVHLDKVKVNIIRIMIFSLVINAIITLNALKINPNLSKIMATGNMELINSLIESKGASGYSIVYSVVIIMPLLFYGLKAYKKVFKLLQLFFIILLIYFVYKAAYTIAFFSIVLGIVVYLFLNQSSKFKILFIPLIILLVIILINPYTIYNMLLYLSNKIDVIQISIRLEQLSKMILYGDDSGDTLYRFVLYKQSITAFLEYPLTGIIIFKPNYSLSGHSGFLDILGGMGLIGFIPYIMFLLYSYKISLRKTNDRRLKNAIKTSYIILLFFGSINTFTTSLTINVFLLYFINWYPNFINSYT